MCVKLVEGFKIITIKIFSFVNTVVGLSTRINKFFLNRHYRILIRKNNIGKSGKVNGFPI